MEQYFPATLRTYWKSYDFVSFDQSLALLGLILTGVEK